MLSNRPTVSRRALLKAFASLPILAGLAFPYPQMMGTRAAGETGHCQDPRWCDSLSAVGREYLRLNPPERSRHRLVQLIESHPALPRGCSLETASAADIETMVTADFAADNLVSLRGWMLARIEARLAALTVV